MFLTKKGKFSHEQVLAPFKKLLEDIKIVAHNFNEIDQVEGKNEQTEERIHYLRAENTLFLPLDWLLSKQSKEIIRQIAEDFIKGNKFENNTSINFVYQELIKLLGMKDFYTLENININDTI